MTNRLPPALSRSSSQQGTPRLQNRTSNDCHEDLLRLENEDFDVAIAALRRLKLAGELRATHTAQMLKRCKDTAQWQAVFVALNQTPAAPG